MFDLFRKVKILPNITNSELKFACYTFSYKECYSLISLIKQMGLDYDHIIVDGIEYLSEFDEELEKHLSLEKSIHVSFKGCNSLNTGHHRHNGNEKLYYFTFYFKYDTFKIDIFFNFVKGSTEIYYAYLANQTDIQWQNETSIYAYEANNRSLKNVRYCKDFTNMKIVDISKNYGRAIFKDGILYVAAYISWFGGIQKIYPMTDFSFGFSVESLQNGLLQVQLFSELNIEMNSNRKIQRMFLQQLNLL